MKIQLTTTTDDSGVKVKREKTIEVANVAGLVRCLMLKEKSVEKEVIDEASRTLKFPKKELKAQLISGILKALEPIKIKENIRCEWPELKDDVVVVDDD